MLFVHDVNEMCDNAICSISEGDKSALSVIYRNYGRMIYSVAFEIVKNSVDAEDVLQDVMVRILEYAHNYRRGSNPKAWVMSIVRNSALDRLKKKNKASSFEEAADNMLTEESSIQDNNDEFLLIRDALGTLTAEERVVVKLKIYAGLTHNEVAKVVGINPVLVRKKYQRSIEKLKKYYNMEGDHN